MNELPTPNDPQYYREKYIRSLADADDPTQRARELANDLFSLDLTVYSSNYTFDSLLYSAMAESTLDHSMSLHPEQIQIISEIFSNDAVIISAPTSFGKTFCVFEYIAQAKPQNIVLIVPTLALVDEYLKRIIKKYKDFFGQYKIHTHVDENGTYDFNCNNIFILTHDRVVQDNTYEIIQQIDFLVIDEVYKLETDPSNDRVLVLNMAYYYLAQRAKKYVLLAPFIKSVEDIEILEKEPVFYNTQYSPVINEVVPINILRHEDRYYECQRLISKLNSDDKMLIYFPTVTGVYKYVNEYIAKEPRLKEINPSIQYFLEWAREEIHEEWCVITAMERGYLIHNGQIPVGTRMFQLDFYETSKVYNKLLCTSTLLEGVNTTAKNIIITKPSRRSDQNNNADDFSAFDFFNLVGRTGRLYRHFIGTAYYIKAPGDPEYKKIDAIRSIRFELTDESKDIDIQKGNVEKYPDVISFLTELGISIDDYHMHIGSHLRFETVRAIYLRYKSNYEKLLNELQRYVDNTSRGRYFLVKLLFELCEEKKQPMKASIINSFLDKRRPKIKKVVDEVKHYYSSYGIDYIISTAINMKTSYIEHSFYPRMLLIRYFLELSHTQSQLIDVLNEKVINPIEYLYFATSKQRKMLVDLGIYERDVEAIVKVVGDDYEDTFELKNRLQTHLDKLQGISFISRYVIQSIL